MARPRVIPVLLLRKNGLVKSVEFKNHRYVGDPMNAVKVFNEKEVDELIFLDIDASKDKREPPYEYLSEIASECFMPLAYGGGIKTIDQIKKLIKSGIEKVIINTSALGDVGFLEKACDMFGSSTIVAAMDVKKNFLGNYQVFSQAGVKVKETNPLRYAKQLSEAGAGEIFLNNVDLDGTMRGYDVPFIKSITAGLQVPVVACGGAGSLDYIFHVIKEGRAAGAAAGSFFVFYGKHRAVLITYPEPGLLREFYVGNGLINL
ncbi:MAG: AglZ/HisF2 family acetamidino modification protein [Bacteroidota bacterium]